MSRHLTPAAAAMLTAVLLLATVAGSVGAATSGPTEDFSFSERGLTAQAVWHTCTDPDVDGITRCTMTQAYLFEGRQRSRDAFGNSNVALSYVCIYREQVAFDADAMLVEPPIVEQGCADDAAIVSNGLETVSASVPALELSEQVCSFDPDTGEGTCELGHTRLVAVEADFVGIGPIFFDRWQSKSRSLVDGVRCSFTSSGHGDSREAIASLTIDGEESGPSLFAQLHDGKVRFAHKCT